MKQKERKIESHEISRDGIAIRESFMASIEQDITNAKLQLSFATAGSPEYEYWTKELQNLYRQKESYGNAI